jgi:hypothetical protein
MNHTIWPNLHSTQMKMVVMSSREEKPCTSRSIETFPLPIQPSWLRTHSLTPCDYHRFYGFIDMAVTPGVSSYTVAAAPNPSWPYRLYGAPARPLALCPHPPTHLPRDINLYLERAKPTFFRLVLGATPVERV